MLFSALWPRLLTENRSASFLTFCSFLPLLTKMQSASTWGDLLTSTAEVTSGLTPFNYQYWGNEHTVAPLDMLCLKNLFPNAHVPLNFPLLGVQFLYCSAPVHSLTIGPLAHTLSLYHAHIHSLSSPLKHFTPTLRFALVFFQPCVKYVKRMTT